MTRHQTDNAGLVVHDLGRMRYADAYRMQRATHARVLSGTSPSTVLLVEHDPVVTVSRRPGAGDHVVADAAHLEVLGIDVEKTDRGGDVTYHGPGQVVVYPIIRLPSYGLNVGRYIRLLEQALVRLVEAFGVAAHTEVGRTGVWAVSPSLAETMLDRPRGEKLCAIGIRVERNVTLHGAAINVCPDLRHYETIVPCGLVGRGVTSFKQILGAAAPKVDQVKAMFVNVFDRALVERLVGGVELSAGYEPAVRL